MKRAFFAGIALAALAGALAVTGGGIPSSLRLSYLGVGRVPSSAQTRIVTDNGGSGDSEIVAGTTTAGDAYFRAVALSGGTNWSMGQQRSSQQWRVCNASGMSGTCLTMDTALNLGAASFNGTKSTGPEFIANNSAGVGTSGHPGYQINVNGARVGFLTEANSTGDFCIGLVAGDICLGASAGNVYITRNDGVSSSLVCTADGTGCPTTGLTSGTFVATLTGCTTSPTVTAQWTKINNQVTLSVPQFLSCTSNSVAPTVTGAPATIFPGALKINPIGGMLDNSVAELVGAIRVETTGVLTILKFSAGASTYSAGLWVGSGTRQMGAFTIVYQL